MSRKQIDIGLLLDLKIPVLLQRPVANCVIYVTVYCLLSLFRVVFLCDWPRFVLLNKKKIFCSLLCSARFSDTN